ncbi:MAG: DMP19 family protein, partial [Planctomycetota bacterium]
LKFLDQYSGQSLDELISLECEYRIDSLVLAFEQAIDQKAEAVGMESLSDEERTVLVVEALEREVNNGGYNQFFLNSKEFTPIIVDALTRIGCPRTAEITQKAIDAIGISVPITPKAIDQVMDEESDQRDEKLNECDEMYYKGKEDIAGRLFEFIKNNKPEIKLK